MELFPGYCIDTSALVDLWRRRYPPDVFPSLWKKIEDLLSQGRLIAPREVLKDLEKYFDENDELLKWTKKHKGFFEDFDEEQQKQVKNILAKFNNLIDEKKTTSESDPFVIALAITKGWKVITSEKPTSPGGKPKIPDVCDKYGIKCIPLLEFFREQKWYF